MAGESAKFESGNKLLALLPVALAERIVDSGERVSLGIRESLYEANQPIPNVYFPIDAVLSMIATMDNGMGVEVATTGNEGMLGLPVFLGVDQTPLTAFCQVPGESFRLSAPQFRKHLQEAPELVSVLNRFAQALMMQISQCTACNRAHAIEQRCCRWLLMTHDRVNRTRFELTQEFLAQMLGVRRNSVGEIAGALQNAKLIQYSRGVIRILNRRGLEKRACGCYFVIRDEYERFLNGRSRR